MSGIGMSVLRMNSSLTVVMDHAPYISTDLIMDAGYTLSTVVECTLIGISSM